MKRWLFFCVGTITSNQHFKLSQSAHSITQQVYINRLFTQSSASTSAGSCLSDHQLRSKIYTLDKLPVISHNVRTSLKHSTLGGTEHHQSAKCAISIGVVGPLR